MGFLSIDDGKPYEFLRFFNTSSRECSVRKYRVRGALIILVKRLTGMCGARENVWQFLFCSVAQLRPGLSRNEMSSPELGIRPFYMISGAKPSLATRAL